MKNNKQNGADLSDLSQVPEPRSDRERERMVEDAEAAFGKADTDYRAEKPKCSCGRTWGIIITLLGLAGAIVGLCVPVGFLLGLGIGVFLLGTVLLYTGMKK